MAGSHNTSPHLVLVGGGHAHALVLRHWPSHAPGALRITLINPRRHAPYSGMLPGHIAGHYPRDALEIDLEALCRFVGATFVLDAACDIDAANRRIKLHSQGWIGYDVASIDIGITSAMPALPGFEAHAVPAKPLDRFAEAWRGFMAEVAAGRKRPEIAVIGGGIAGAELAMAMGFALRQKGAQPGITVLEAGPKLNGMSPAPARLLAQEMAAQGVDLRLNARVAEIQAEGCVLDDGARIAADFVLGAAGATQQGWLAETGLAVQEGALIVAPDLSLPDHPTLFAAGDCAHIAHAPRPKAGVYAVRAAPILANNLVHRLTGQGEAQRFDPQSDYLKLVSLGRKSAMAERFGMALSGGVLWRLKDRIDRRFMAQFDGLS